MLEWNADDLLVPNNFRCSLNGRPCLQKSECCSGNPQNTSTEISRLTQFTLQAYIQGQNNNNHKDIVEQVRAVLFLSTPHRGTDLAETLNRILSVSIFNHKPKQYINELRQNSSLIQDLNEDFRNYASKLQIFSFYETLKTAVGPKNIVCSLLASPFSFRSSLFSDGPSEDFFNPWLPRRREPTPRCGSSSSLQVS
jgi:hypothetical protein